MRSWPLAASVMSSRFHAVRCITAVRPWCSVKAKETGFGEHLSPLAVFDEVIGGSEAQDILHAGVGVGDRQVARIRQVCGDPARRSLFDVFGDEIVESDGVAENWHTRPIKIHQSAVVAPGRTYVAKCAFDCGSR